MCLVPALMGYSEYVTTVFSWFQITLSEHITNHISTGKVMTTEQHMHLRTACSAPKMRNDGIGKLVSRYEMVDAIRPDHKTHSANDCSSLPCASDVVVLFNDNRLLFRPLAISTANKMFHHYVQHLHQRPKGLVPHPSMSPQDDISSEASLFS